MAQQLSSAYVTLFDARVKQAYQAQSVLRGTVRTRTNVEGATVKFPKIGKGSAQVRIPQTDVTPINASYSQVTCTLEDWIAAEYSDVFMRPKVNFDETQELVQVVAGAIGRRMDQLIIDALAASGTSLTVSNDIGGTDSNMNMAKMREAKRLLDAKNVPMQGRHLLIHADSLASLLSDSTVTSSDFNTIQALVRGELRSYLGFNIITIGDRDEGGLAIDGNNDRSIYAWHTDAVGYAEGIAPRTEINYVPEKTSFLISSMLSAGAVTIDAEGVVAVTARE